MVSERNSETKIKMVQVQGGDTSMVAQLVEPLTHSIRDSGSILTSTAVRSEFACILDNHVGFLPYPKDGLAL